MIDHTILLETLESDFGIVGNVFFLGKEQHVVIDQIQSEDCGLTSGVPQGSCFGPVLFLLYASGILKIISKQCTVVGRI